MRGEHMRYKRLLIVLFTVAFIMSCSKDPGHIDVTWQLIKNQYRGKSQHKSELTITNNSRYTLTKDNWTYYFSWFRTVVDEQESEIIDGETINGDYSKIYPTEEFPELEPGESLSFPLIGSHYALHRTDAPTGGYFIVNPRLGTEVIVPSGDTEVLPFPEGEDYKRAAYDNLPVEDAESRYEENKSLSFLDSGKLPPVFPTPSYVQYFKDKYYINADIDIHYYQTLGNEVRYLQERLKRILDPDIMKYKFRSEEFSNHSANHIVLNLMDGEPGSYRLEVDPGSGVRIYGSDPAGVFYGIQSFFSLFPPESLDGSAEKIGIPQLIIEDGPRFTYRGMHLDVSRSFHDKEYVMDFLELLARYKFNKLHFHITDDEGWRVEIPGLPELTEIGAFRGHTEDERDHLQPALGSGPYPDPEKGAGSGYYSREDFIEILRFAKNRHIEVIPEIDMPGHIRSGVKAMEARYYRYMEEGKTDSAEMYLLTDFADTSHFSSAQRFNDNVANPCMESTYRFVELVIDELISMYKEADAPFTTLHIGGDEVPRGAFRDSPVCQKFLQSQDTYNSTNELHKYFTERVSDMLQERGLYTAGWEEVACKHENGGREPDPSLVDEEIIVYIWNNIWGWGAEDLGYKLANAGFPIVMLNATNLYFDFAYGRDPQEPGLNWGGYSDTRSAWEFTPFDVTKCAEETLYGNPIEPDLFKDKEFLTEEGKRNVKGLSGTLWGENLRTWERVEYMAFPKMLGLAERAWSVQPEWARTAKKDERVHRREKDWNIFVNKLGQDELPRLDRYGVNYRIPLPGAVIEDGMLKANIRFPGLTLRYTTDGSKPFPTSTPYTEPVAVKDGETVKIAAFASNGRSSRIVTLP